MFSKWSLYTPLSIDIRNGLVSTGSVAHRVYGESLQSCLATHHVHATLHFNGSRIYVHAMLHFNGSRIYVHAMLHFNGSRLHVHAMLHFNGSRIHVHAMLHFNGSRLHVHAMLHFNYSRLRSQLPPWVCPSKRVA